MITVIVWVVLIIACFLAAEWIDNDPWRRP